mmetsp:Transcript_18549/g.40144  ORF Transcript_18549/g.40144 Transcript_18549/m.40144 type:complete len:89 (+) Transcript_18549:538-804(+)
MRRLKQNKLNAFTTALLPLYITHRLTDHTANHAKWNVLREHITVGYANDASWNMIIIVRGLTAVLDTTTIVRFCSWCFMSCWVARTVP